MQTEPNAKQQIVERIKNSSNILVTVGNNPTVDELSAALALSLMLDRLDKHATAVFSGAVPPAISFLQPEKTFENTVDSLRDFIIALDKAKADRLRYKVENDVVRIFITPYKTTITDKDLQFSQGDFNVELVIALGVEKREDLDTAITAHGRILHDATVVTVNADANKSSLGAIDWSESGASSLCEMLMSLSEALQGGLLDEQIATALLTGIVAATDRFRNEHTSPRVMTMSAQLMAAGANQQLIATKLEEGNGFSAQSTKVVQTDEAQAIPADVAAPATEPAQSKKDGSLQIDHSAEDAAVSQEKDLADSLPQPAEPNPTGATLSVEDMQRDLAQASQEAADAAEEPMIKKGRRTWRSSGDPNSATPSFGGTLNATTSDAEEEKRREELSDTNHEILSHDGAVEPEQPVPAEQPIVMPQPPTLDEPVTPPADGGLQQSHSDGDLSYEPAPIAAPQGPTLAELDSQTRGRETDDARAAVDAALNSMPYNPANNPAQSTGALPGLEVAHEPMATPEQPQNPEPTPTTGTPASLIEPLPAPLEEPAPAPAPEASPVPPPLPPLPDFSTLPPLPGEPAPAPSATVPVPDTTPLTQPPITPSADGPIAPASTDPAQFKIPGQ